jgi:hypothetical protein
MQLVNEDKIDEKIRKEIVNRSSEMHVSTFILLSFVFIMGMGRVVSLES